VRYPVKAGTVVIQRLGDRATLPHVRERWPRPRTRLVREGLDRALEFSKVSFAGSEIVAQMFAHRKRSLLGFLFQCRRDY